MQGWHIWSSIEISHWAWKDRFSINDPKNWCQTHLISTLLARIRTIHSKTSFKSVWDQVYHIPNIVLVWGRGNHFSLTFYIVRLRLCSSGLTSLVGRLERALWVTLWIFHQTFSYSLGLTWHPGHQWKSLPFKITDETDYFEFKFVIRDANSTYCRW